MTVPEPPAAGSSRAPSLRVGYVPGVTLTKWRQVWSQRFPKQPLAVVEVARPSQRQVLDAGEVDLCFVRLPILSDGLHVIRLYDEVPVVVVPKDHPVAAFDDITCADLAGETMLDPESADALDRVAWGAGLVRLPHSVARAGSRRDLVYRPITDAAPTTIAVAWGVDDPHPLIEEFIGIVRGRTVNSSRTAQARAAQGTGVPAPPAAGPTRRAGSRPAPSSRSRRTRGGR